MVTDPPTLAGSAGSASAETVGTATGGQSPRDSAPLSRRELFGPEKSKKRAGRVARRIISVVIVLLALVVFWPAQYGGVTGLTVVDGESMEPTYVTGDLVVSIRQPSYAIGEVISYTVPSGQDGAGGRVIHRVNSISQGDSGPTYMTLGDNNGDQPDPWIIGNQDIMGKALFAIPGVGNLIGGMSNPLLIGLISGILVTVILWSSDSKEEKRLKKAQKAERERGGAL